MTIKGGISAAFRAHLPWRSPLHRARLRRGLYGCRFQPTTDLPDLDEVEIFGPAQPNQNLALHKPADQSSLSIWSTSKLIPPPPSGPLPLPIKEVLERGRQLAGDLTEMGLDTASYESEFAAVATRLALAGAGSARNASGTLLRRAASRAQAGLCRSAAAVQSTALCEAIHAADLSGYLFESYALGLAAGGDICVLDNPFTESCRAASCAYPDRPARTGPCARDGSVVGRHRIVFGYARKKSFDPPIQPWPPASCTCRNNVTKVAQDDRADAYLRDRRGRLGLAPVDRPSLLE